ncbi:MAG: NADP-dependent isocitrate dehydrogenase [Bacteroidota bacterium]|jgi:isocitrate dehydrogenase|nr:NADP-dependent isocitrate dehydrogenase [Sphingobacteriales bacterium]
MKIAVAKGDGIGPEIMDAVLGIFNAASVPLQYEFIEMGKTYFEQGHSTGMTPQAKEVVESLGILFKGPMETPKGKGMKSINVTARKTWSTYANRRHFQSLPGVDTVFSKAGIPIDITIVRENIEGTYGGIEHLNTNDVAICRRIISRPGSEQVVRFAFEMARKEGFTKVTCAHKANIMKLTDGLFLETFQEVAKEYPEINSNDIIVDDLAMKLVARPHEFQVVVLTNLQGDIMSDLCAGLVGGLGFAPSANIGDNISIFEAVHGTAPDIAGKLLANPTSLLLSGLMMLRHLGYVKQAAEIENALRYTLEQGTHTADFGDRTIAPSNTNEFADAIIKNLGQKPEFSKPRDAKNDVKLFVKPAKPAKQKMMETTKDATAKKIAGVDFFIETALLGPEIADKLKLHLGTNQELTMISNRGTMVWPTGSVFTECVNHYRVRVEGEMSQQEIYILLSSVSKDFYIPSHEVLRVYGEKKGYSLAQGQ